MKLHRKSIVAFAAFAIVATNMATAMTQHAYKLITTIEPPQATTDCLYFQLAGVGEADPLTPNNPWFAMPRSHPGFREIYAMILMTKATGMEVVVRTTGSLAGGACGNYVGVHEVYIP
jgi:hypothetical protein